MMSIIISLLFALTAIVNIGNLAPAPEIVPPEQMEIVETEPEFVDDITYLVGKMLICDVCNEEAEGVAFVDDNAEGGSAWRNFCYDCAYTEIGFSIENVDTDVFTNIIYVE